MGFSEKSQAFLIGAWYDALTGSFEERGRQTFILAVKHYAMQRGGRMAQRAVRDGQPLTYATFCGYGEWAPSEEAVQNGSASVMDVKSTMPDFVFHVNPCAWHQAFTELGAQEAGRLYCKYLDEAINQGFNGAIRFSTVETKHWSDACVFCIKDAGFTPDTKIQRHPQYVKGFDYHCAHTHYAFAEIAAGVFGAEGEALADRVLDAFKAAYGEEMLGRLTAFATENFDRA